MRNIVWFASGEVVVTESVARQITDLTERRFVALYRIGFDILVGDDGRTQFRVFDEDGLAVRLDNALAAAAERGSGRVKWLLYDQKTGECHLRDAQDLRQVLHRQKISDSEPH